jgi:hypothetical protein
MKFKDIVQNKSVALIGNALSLYDYQFGEEIDNHDVVIRLNIPGNIIYKNEKELISTGKKIDIWCLWKSQVFIEKVLDKEECDQRLIDYFNNIDIYKAEVMQSDSNKIECLYDKISLDNLNRDIEKFLLSEKYKSQIKERQMIYMLRYNNMRGIKNNKHNVSTGTLVLNYLLNDCNLKNLDIYGMDFKKTPTFYDITSHEKNMRQTRIDHAHGHNYDTEERYSLHLMSERKNIKIRGLLEK